MTTPLLFNPVAGRGRNGETLKRIAAGRDIELVAARDPEETRRLAAQLGSAHPRVIVAGGDGTIHHALRGFAGSAAVVGLVPTGTANDFAGALGIPLDLPAAVERALTAPGRAVDLGRAQETPFGGIAGVGLIAAVLTYLDGFTRRFRGNWIYPWAVLRTLLSFRPLEARLESAQGRYEGPVLLVLAANAPRIGGGMRAAPDAAMDDGLLDIVILAPTGRLRLIRLLHRVYRGTHVSDPAITLMRAQRVELGTRPATQVYADGEAMPVDTGAAAVIRVDPGAIRVAL